MSAVHRINDGEDIAAAAQAGADVPFMRPQLLATDTATSESVLVHALQWLEETAIPPISLFICSQQNLPFTGIDNRVGVSFGTFG